MTHHTHFGFNQHTMRGATLIEVIVSVFLLTFGVLGLMAAQIRSVSSVTEAENRSVVAQASENLADAMQMNPFVTDRDGPVLRRYDDYIVTTPVSITPDPNATAPASLWASGSASNITKANLARRQIDDFQHHLNQVPNASRLAYVICRDRPTPQEPEYSNGNMSAHCNPTNSASDITVIKVVWEIQTQNAKSEPVVYSYQLPVPQ